MTALWNAQDIAAATRGATSGSWTASSVSIDSRTIQKGDLFIALQGPNHDGHDHVEAAIAAGAAGLLVHHEPKAFSSDSNDKLLLVKDTFTALNDLGRAARARCDGKIVAVTGSVGKTGTKEALKLAFAALGATYATSGNLNNHWGVPLSLARMARETQFSIFEIGMNHAGEIAPLAKLVAPHVVIITTVAAVHLEFFDSVAGIADEKASIAAGLIYDGMAILPADSEFFDRLCAQVRSHRCRNIISFGADGDAQARLVSAAFNAKGMQVAADILGQRITFDLGVTGRQWAINALAVLAAVKVIGGDVLAAAAALSQLTPTKGRGTRTAIQLQGGSFTLIDESYNASPASVKALAETLGQIKANSKKRVVLVLGDMLELGTQSAELHAELQTTIVANGIDTVFTAGPLMEHLHHALPREKRGGHTKDAATLAPLVAASVKPGDVLAVKGSNGSRMSHVVEALGSIAHPMPKAANGS
ncbi:MAG: UDP-N-acetylmuramoylalanyl-D-glutamyl-2,6-diaminopimelate--D-alanyl-D-alanine ligase [Alphaproteobacteria bacterium]|nr:UDP-N-acetylmuramoylalanyl-D-glutamyl-2,6-diaminopimelate--D-alanyl-D-alanine ligase [Alphaproteobacteria bacterium]PHX99679.1 MAG: UDP-N-acetylmuramoylalanyl-D-glutamyl-2, 6-diaminopimelate--D-alanyl-D-alanine ligase [Rhodospirillaceae bacterium]